MGEGNAVIAVEFEFLFDDAVGFAAFFTFDGPVNDFVGDVFDVVGNLVGGNSFFDVGHFFFLVFPLPFFGEDFVFGHGEVVLGDGFVVAEIADFGWEIFAPFAGFLHVFDNFAG